MRILQFHWDLDEELGGNVQHIAEHGVTKEEVEEVLLAADESDVVVSRSSGLPLARGYTSAGRYLIVIFQRVDDASVYPITAYGANGD